MSIHTHETICPLCQSNQLKAIFGKDHFIRKCNNCSFVFSGLIPSNKTLNTFYSQYPSHEHLPEITLCRYNQLLDMLEPYRKNNKLLETGCGYGLFLEEAKKRKWDVYGTEYSESALKKCSEKELIVKKSLDEIRNFGPFDAIVSIEVLEHVALPVHEIQEYSTLIRSHGALYITTPNFNSLSRYLLGKKWNVIIFPEHLSYFTSKTINRLLTKNNFSKQKIETFGISPGRLIYAYKNRGKKAREKKIFYDYNLNDREMSNLIDKNIFLKWIKGLMNMVLNATRKGDTLKILYNKK